MPVYLNFTVTVLSNVPEPDCTGALADITSTFLDL